MTIGRRLAARLVLLLAPVLAAGCGGGVPDITGTAVSVSHPVWMSDGWVYYLREEGSQGAQLWRQHESDGPGSRVLRAADVAGTCDGGVLSFLFPAGPDEVGIATECDGGDRTELTAYSTSDGGYRRIASAPFLAGAAVTPGHADGYAEVPTECGVAIRPIRGGSMQSFPGQITVAGKSWPLSGAGPGNCAAAAWVRSPAIAPGGGLYFVAAPDSIGKLPATKSDALDKFSWYLVQWDAKGAEARVVAPVRGVADLAVSPDGRSVLVAVSSASSGGVWLVDPSTGKAEEIVEGQQAYHPSLSPDGRRFVYVEELSKLRFMPLPGGG